jgi:SP family galactose:H+ symporter-like MFS transporter
MGLLHDLQNTSRLGLLVAVAAATVGVIYGYDSSNIAGALLFMTEDFEAMGFQGNFALLGLPALVQVAGLAAVYISLILVDRMGRRPILLSGIGIMILANALLVAVFSIGSEFGGALTAIGFLGLLLFTVGFTFGFGALVWVYAGESFPARLRSLGSSAMLTSDLVANVAVAAIFLTLLTRFGGAGTFIVFGVLAVAAFAFVFKLAPETKGRHLEEIRHCWENGGKWPTASVAATAEQFDKAASGTSAH